LSLMEEFLEENGEIIRHVKSIAKSLNGSIQTQGEMLLSALSSLNTVKKEFELDFSNREREFRELNHVSRDIKDNFSFTLSIVDEIKIIDKTVGEINELALHLAIESKKLDEESQKIFSERSKSIREMSDTIKDVIDKIFTKEIRNKTFSEHNRYIRNSVVHRIDDEVSTIGKYIENRDEHLKRVNKIERFLNSIQETVSQNGAMAVGIEKLMDAFTVNGEKRDFGIHLPNFGDSREEDDDFKKRKIDREKKIGEF
jgi:methyl-accepting chemotaxis protein